MNHQNIRKTYSAVILLVILAAAALYVKPQPTYECLEWKFRVVDNWGLWGDDAAKYDPLAKEFGAVAYLFNSTPKTTPWSFENWELRGKGVADKKGWITICVPRSYDGVPDDNNPNTNRAINYSLVVKLTIRGMETPITIYNGTILTIGETSEQINYVGLEELLDKTITTASGVHPSKSWITAGPGGVNRANKTETYEDKVRGVYKTWLYYIAMQPLDENMFPVTGATLTVLFDSNYAGSTWMGNTKTSAEDWVRKLYGKWTVNGSIKDEFIPDTDVDSDGTIYDPNYKVGWVILRIPLINSTTAYDNTWKSSLVNAMEFWWTYKTNTTIAAMRTTTLDAPAIGEPWGNLNPAGYSNYVLDPLTGNDPLPNSTHRVNVNVKWTGIRLLDCYGNNWWTMKAEVTGFDTMYKDQYQLMATRVAPGTYLLRYPVPTALSFINYDFETGTQGWYAATQHYGPGGGDTGVARSTAQAHSGSASLVVHWTDPTQPAKPHVDFDSPIDLRGKTITVWVWVPVSGLWAEIYAQGPNYSGWYASGGVSINDNQWVKLTWAVPDNAPKFQRLGVQVGGAPGQAINFYIDDFDWPEPPAETTISLSVEWYYSTVNFSRFLVSSGIDELEGSLDDPVELKCNMTWVSVSFWSGTELPQPVSDFAAKIILPSTMGYRKADPLTIWWNGRGGGFVVFPDMEYYAGPNPSTLDELDPYEIARDDNFADFWSSMSQNAGNYGGFGGQGWLPTREVGWVDFKVYYEGVEVLDTYKRDESLKLPCCASTPPESTSCHYNFTLNIYEIGFRIILEACGKKMDAPSGVPFFFKHPSLSALNPDEPLTGPKFVHDGKVDIVKAPYGSYSDFAIVWQMSVLRPYKIEYLLDNGTTIELQEPILLDRNMRNIQLYFRLWNLTVDPWSQDPFRLVNVEVTLFSVSNFELAPGVGISKRQLDQITDEGPPPNTAYHHVLPAGWVIYHRATSSSGFPVIYYHTDTQVNYWNSRPSWNFLPEKEYWIWVRVPGGVWNPNTKKWDTLDPDLAEAAGFRRVDANATLYWSGDPWNKPLYLDTCYGIDSPYVVKTYVYDPNFAIKTACGEPLVFRDTDNSALILAEPWYSNVEPDNLFYRQQIDPTTLVSIGTPGGVYNAKYNAYLIRKNSTTANGIVTIKSVNASKTKPEDPDLWNQKTGKKAENYPIQSRYLIGQSPGSWPIVSTKPEYRVMLYYKGVLVFNESIVLSNPYASKDNVIKASVYPYVFRATNDPLKGPGSKVFGVEKIKVTVFWAGLNMTWWPTKHLVYETAPIEFSLLNASKLEKGFNMSVVKRLWGPVPSTLPDATQLEWIPRRPDICPPYFSAKVVVESQVTDIDGKAVFLIPVWNYSVTDKIYTWILSDGSIKPVLLEEVCKGPRVPWNVTQGPLAVNLLTYEVRKMKGALFGTPVYANFTTIPGETNNIPEDDIVRLAAVLNASRYCRWIQYSMNATGLVNPATKTWKETRCKMVYPSGAELWRDGVSLNTTYRASYKSQWWAGVGMLSGGAYQHRAPDSETGITVLQGQDGCYAKAEERVPANDLGIVVRNVDGIGLPNQKVTVIREAIYVDGNLVGPRKVLLEDWTPTTFTADPPDYYALYLRSTPSNILWGFYEVTIRTENLTRGMSNRLLRLDDPQCLAITLPGGEVDWVSAIYHLDWPARLKITILTEDGRPLEKAWVYIVDGYTGGNVTAAITDKEGHAGTLVVGQGNAAPSPSIYMEPGDKVNIGFNLLRGWYWLDANDTLTGKAVNPNWDMVNNNEPKQPIGDEYEKVITYDPDGDGPEEPITGKARFYGRYYVKVFYKPAGCSEVLGPVVSEVVFNSYATEAQHQYIYLGVWPETGYVSGGGTASFSVSQDKTYHAWVNDLKMSFVDAAGRPLTNVKVKAKHPQYGWEDMLTFDSGESNTVTMVKVPLKSGTSYSVHAEWTSQYGTKAVVDTSVKDLLSTITMPVYDVKLGIVTKKGTPLVGASVSVANKNVGTTSAPAGEVLVTQIPAGTYPVSAKWLDTDLTGLSLTVTTSGTVTTNPTNVHTLTVRVLGAQGQAIEGATVRVTKGAIELTRLTDKDGKAEIELPSAGYNVEVTYGNFKASDSITLNTDTVKTFNLDVFLELFGVGMTMAQFLLLIVMIIIIVIVLAVVVHEYHIYRRKKLPQLFGAPAAPK